MFTATGAHAGGGLDSTLIIHKTEGWTEGAAAEGAAARGGGPGTVAAEPAAPRAAAQPSSASGGAAALPETARQQKAQIASLRAELEKAKRAALVAEGEAARLQRQVDGLTDPTDTAEAGVSAAAARWRRRRRRAAAELDGEAAPIDVAGTSAASWSQGPQGTTVHVSLPPAPALWRAGAFLVLLGLLGAFRTRLVGTGRRWLAATSGSRSGTD